MYTGVEIFSGAGGLSLGASMAGIFVETAVEKNEKFAQTYIHNHSKTNVLVDDIANVDFSHYGEEPFILFGGPPCQGFSSSNTINRNLSNEKNHLYLEFVRVVDELKPEWIVFENVEGFKTLQKGVVVKWLKDEIEKLDLNYSMKDCVLTASDFGVPQRRNRYFLVGNRKNIDYKFPDRFDFQVTVGEALQDLPSLQNGHSIDKEPYKSKAHSQYAKLMRGRKRISTQNFVSKNSDYVVERYKYIPQGGNWRDIPEFLMTNYKNRMNCHSGIYRRLSEKSPSCVISNYRKNMLIHPHENRGLSVREAARLQSFPDSFVFKGTLEHIQQQIGNAVPPLLAKSVFDSIVEQHERRK